MNVMTHGLEKRSPLLPLGLEVQSAYATLVTGSGRVPVVLRNNTKDWLEIKKGTPIARMVAANLVPRVINAVSAKGPDPASTLMEAERQDLLLDKLDLVQPRGVAYRASGKGSRPPEGVPRYLFP